jgi:hypothetical protein
LRPTGEIDSGPWGCGEYVCIVGCGVQDMDASCGTDVLAQSYKCFLLAYQVPGNLGTCFPCLPVKAPTLCNKPRTMSAIIYMVSDSSRFEPQSAVTDPGEQLTDLLITYNNADALVRACHDGNTFQLLEE